MVGRATHHPQRRCTRIAACGLAAVLLPACAPSTRLQVDPSYVPRPTPVVYDDRDWAAVLSGNVRSGRVDYQALRGNRLPLDRYLGLISVMGPEATPDLFRPSADRVCYYINAYNACVLQAVLQYYPTPTVYGLDRPSLVHGHRFSVDGREVTLGQIQEKLERAGEGDMRVLFGLCGAALGTPALASEPYRPGPLHEQLRQAVRSAVDNPHLVRVDSNRRQLLVWNPLRTERDKFLEGYRRSANAPTAGIADFLLQQAGPGANQSLASARNYDLRALAFDRTLNDMGNRTSSGP